MSNTYSQTALRRLAAAVAVASLVLVASCSPALAADPGGDTGHILGMGIGYTAMLTAFYVDNGPHLPLWDRLPTLAFWLLPSAVAAPLIARAVIHARRGRGPHGATQHGFTANTRSFPAGPP